jgi:hypothetical protein
MSRERAWYVGLSCVVCGERVTQKGDGLYVFPVGGKPWARHASCREKKEAAWRARP